MAQRQRALITGGGSGIGAALARHLARRDVDVIIAGRRQETLDEVCATAPDRISSTRADLADPAGRDTLAVAAGEAPLDFLVHNAGVLAPVAPIGEIDAGDLRTNLTVNVEAQLLLTQSLIPHFADSARVLLVSSGAAHHPIEGWSAYCLAKAAQVMLGDCLNLELNGRGILTATAHPGVVDTPMQAEIRELAEDRFPGVRRFRELHDHGKLRNPEEVAAFLGWLLLECGPGAYPSREWDIDDPDHQILWQEGWNL